MHITNDARLLRPDFVYSNLPDGSYYGWPKSSRPYINRKHVDGPLLHTRDGQLYWLTPWERLLLWLGKTDAEKLERKYRPLLSDT